jgi:hypothetical protein
MRKLPANIKKENRPPCNYIGRGRGSIWGIRKVSRGLWRAYDYSPAGNNVRFSFERATLREIGEALSD